MLDFLQRLFTNSDTFKADFENSKKLANGGKSGATDFGRECLDDVAVDFFHLHHHITAGAGHQFGFEGLNVTLESFLLF